MQTPVDIAQAHSFLFVLASRPERVAKAIVCSAEVVIIDLEDAVGPAAKNQQPGRTKAIDKS